MTQYEIKWHKIIKTICRSKPDKPTYARTRCLQWRYIMTHNINCKWEYIQKVWAGYIFLQHYCDFGLRFCNTCDMTWRKKEEEEEEDGEKKEMTMKKEKGDSAALTPPTKLSFHCVSNSPAHVWWWMNSPPNPSVSFIAVLSMIADDRYSYLYTKWAGRNENFLHFVQHRVLLGGRSQLPPLKSHTNPPPCISLTALIEKHNELWL